MTDITTVMRPDEFEKLKGRAPATDLIVFDEVTPDTLASGTTLCLGSIPRVDGFEQGDVVESPTILKWNEEHPLTQYVNFRTLHVSKLMVGKEPPWMRPLLSSDLGPAISVGEQGDARLVVVRFGLLESDWPLRVSFPLFISNLVRWAKDVDVMAGEGVVRPGQPLVLTVPPESSRGTLVGPDGSERPLEPGDSRQVLIADTEIPGVYRARWEGRATDSLYAVNLLDPSESDVAVPGTVEMGGTELIGKNESALVRRELTVWFLLAAVGLLFLEWFLYQFRR